MKITLSKDIKKNARIWDEFIFAFSRSLINK
jgi:hypothetical protein